jgi:hypothetical protein
MAGSWACHAHCPDPLHRSATRVATRGRSSGRSIWYGPTSNFKLLFDRLDLSRANNRARRVPCGDVRRRNRQCGLDGSAAFAAEAAQRRQSRVEIVRSTSCLIYGRRDILGSHQG